MSELLGFKSFPFKEETIGISISLDMPDPSDNSLNIKLYIPKENIEFIGPFIRINNYSQKQYFSSSCCPDDKDIIQKFPFAICFVRPWILPISSIIYIEELDFQPTWLRRKWAAMRECFKSAKMRENNIKSLWTKIKTLLKKS